jgi:4'-phosphopantetheinyl transferase
MKNTSIGIGENEIALFHYCIPEKINSVIFQLLISSLSFAEQQYLNSIQNEEAQKRTLFGRIILRYVATLLGINEPELISFTNSGKPIFKSSSRIEFNISHSSNQVVCCVAFNSPVGIDLEFIRLVDIEIYRNYLNWSEWQFIIKSETPELTFLKLWVRKEAVIKADGRGMEIELSSLNCLKSTTKTMYDTWYIQEVEISPDFQCAVACNRFKNIQLFDFNTIFKPEDINRDMANQTARLEI